jgi:hypothetical protein
MSRHYLLELHPASCLRLLVQRNISELKNEN